MHNALISCFRRRRRDGHEQALCLVGMEACGGSNDWAHKLAAMGHEVRLISPQFVKPYVRGNKNDMADAAAIYEAVSRPNMRFVPIKSLEQQDIQSLHRTAQVNQIRELLMEYGLVVARSVAALRQGIPEILEDADNALSPMFRELLCRLWDEFLRLDTRVAGYMCATFPLLPCELSPCIAGRSI